LLVIGHSCSFTVVGGSVLIQWHGRKLAAIYGERNWLWHHFVTFIREFLARVYSQSSSIHARHDAGRPIKSHLHRLRRARRGVEAVKWPDGRSVGVDRGGEIRGPTSKEIVRRRERTRGERTCFRCSCVVYDGEFRRFIKRDVERRDKLPLSSFAFTPWLNRW